MVTRERFALDDDLKSLLCWLVKACHEEMQVTSQGAHDSNLAR